MEGRTQAKFGYDRETLGDYPGDQEPVVAEVATKLDFADWLEQQTPARRKVMEALARGLSTAQAAAELGCGEHNVQYLRDKCRKIWRRDHAET
jgi:hypothetical protein